MDIFQAGKRLVCIVFHVQVAVSIRVAVAIAVVRVCVAALFGSTNF